MVTIEVYHSQYPESVITFTGNTMEEALAKADKKIPPSKSTYDLVTNQYCYRIVEVA
jgi:hypothetical protein